MESPIPFAPLPGDRPERPTGRVPAILGLLALLALVAAGFGGALHAGLVAEDFASVESTWTDVLSEATGSGGLPGLRPGTRAVFAALRPLAGRDPAVYRGALLAAHAVAAWLVFLLAARLTDGWRPAILPAALFALAPVHVESVVWLASAAGTVPAGLLALAAAWVWVRRPAGPSATDAWLAAALYLAALLFKEVAAPLPLLLATLELGLPDRSRRWRTGDSDRVDHHLVAARAAPFVAAAAAYGAALLLSGSWESIADYGVTSGAPWYYYLSVWSAYAHDLLRPLLPDKPWALSPERWSTATVDLVALGLWTLILVLLRRGRWALAWVALALLPGWTKYGERLTYLAVAGVALLVAAALRPTRAPEGAASSRRRILAVLVATAALIALDLRALAPEIRNWVLAGRHAEDVPRQLADLVHDPPPGARFYFRGLIDDFDGAYSLRMGAIHEVRRIYDDPTLEVFIVADRRPRGPRILLSGVPCRADGPRYLLLYDRASGTLRDVDEREFDLDCAEAPPEPGAPG